ncbi:styrene monooxygenase/indole monooxygenase family protein [Nocardia sp. NPDC052254]|uniref:styrene monooxygenase/indole monooxygenase family protein n=1 Tax=Nocardia sp. NPDC052254 TaxID=3155681 RepID=UPI00341FDACF
MYTIGIVGTGISALHLALMLQQHGVATTVYADKTPEQLRAGRLPNNVCRFGRTRERERALGVDHWHFPDFEMGCAHVRVRDDPAISFRGDLTRPASYVDFRLYLPRLLEDYRRRGGTVVDVAGAASALVRHQRDHDLMVVATGGRGLGEMFARVPDRSADRPPRYLLAGLFHGVAHTDPIGMHLEIVPGVGEIFQTPVHSLVGQVAGITFEAIPGGPWADRVRRNYYDDPDACAATVRDLVHGTEIADRIDPDAFALTRPLDLLQGSVVPTVRVPWARLDSGRFAVAIGDAAVLNDPVTGQGGNLASAAAWELGRAIVSESVFDERFCRDWADRLWTMARDVTEWTGSALGPPPQQVFDVFRAAARNQAVADAYLDNFDDPRAMWSAMATPERASAFLARAGGGLAACVPDRAVVDRELRLLDALHHRDPNALYPFAARDGMLVDPHGSHRPEDWQRAVAAVGGAGRPTGMSVVELAESALLVTYRQTGMHCSTVWRRDTAGTWAVAVHHRSPTPQESL